MCADAQAGLHLCCSQTPEDRFSRDEAHTIIDFNEVDMMIYLPEKVIFSGATRPK